MTQLPTTPNPARPEISTLAKELTDLGYVELFHRLTKESLDSIWNQPGSADLLAKVAVDQAVSKQANFLAAEILFSKQPAYPPDRDKRWLAVVYAAALASNSTRLTNAWGLPGRLDGLAGQHLVALGEAVVPELVLLLNDETPMVYAGSREATEGNRFHYRVKDFAAYFISQIRGLAFSVDEDPAQRDKEIAKLQGLPF